ncbi:MAG: hypothetical protein KKH28_06130 [Elusimicrobia bacterium]|nr:hypothetical protein [Elusimicrobiota bacterium]
MKAIKDNKKYYRMLSIGYNGDRDFFPKVVLPFKKYISSVYSSPGTSLGISSARFTPNIAPGRLLKFRENLKSAGIEFNLVYNFDGIPDALITRRLAAVAEILKPDLITVNGTFILDAFLKLGKYKLNISIINDINSINQLCQLLERDRRGLITSYNIGRRKTYDLRYLASVRKRFPGLNLKLMVNEGCVFECPDQNFHSCTMTMTHGRYFDPGIFYCHKLEPGRHWRFLTGQYIPPKFLPAYRGLADEFKIATRGAHGEPVENGFICGLLAEYINEEDITVAHAMRTSFGGSFFAREYFQGDRAGGAKKPGSGYPMPYPEDFFKIRTSCAHNCYECSYCKDILK